MSDIFSTENELIDIELNYVIEKNKSGVTQVTVIDDEKAAKMKADPVQKDKIKTLRTQWRPLTWQASNELLQRANNYNFHTNSQEIDYIKFRDAKIKACLVGWDAKTEKGDPIPCAETYINKLHANVAIALLTKYDEAITVNQEQQTKN